MMPRIARAAAAAGGFLLLLAGGAFAQGQSAGPAVELPKPQDIEPGVDTSASSAPARPAPAAIGLGEPRGSAAKGTPPVSRPAGPPVRAAQPGAPAPKAGSAQDRLDLDSTQITGNRELPKVLYIVPWKRPDIGDLSGRPPNSLLDEVLAPVDRDVFQRENRYYDALKPDSPHAAATPGRVTETAEPGADQPRNAP